MCSQSLRRGGRQFGNSRSALVEILNEHFSQFANWSEISATTPEDTAFKLNVGRQLCHPNKSALEAAPRLIKEIIAAFQRYSELYDSKAVEEQIADFLAEEQALFSDVNLLVEDTKSDEVAKLLKKSKDPLFKEETYPVIRSLSYYTDRLVLHIIETRDHRQPYEQGYSWSPNPEGVRELSDTTARSRAFGPEGLEKIPDNQINPLRGEDHQVMGK